MPTPHEQAAICISFSTRTYGTFPVGFGHDRSSQRTRARALWPSRTRSIILSPDTNLTHSQTPHVESQIAPVSLRRCCVRHAAPLSICEGRPKGTCGPTTGTTVRFQPPIRVRWRVPTRSSTCLRPALQNTLRRTLESLEHSVSTHSHTPLT